MTVAPAMSTAGDFDWPAAIAVNLRVSGADGTADLSLNVADGVFDPSRQIWSIVGPLEIRNRNGRLLATLSEASIRLNSDPSIGPAPGGPAPFPRGPGGIVEMAFGVTNGSAAPTNFIITSALVAFQPLIDPQARASAGMLLSDNNGNGATLTGGHAGGTKSYRAAYNGQAPGGSTFATLLDNLTVAMPYGTASVTEGFPPGMFATIPGTVGDASAQFDFTLSGRDSAAATAVFAIIPEPATLALLVLTATALLRRRR